MVIPDGVTSIERSCFRDCTSLTNVTLPEDLTKPGGYCFMNCSSLRGINIPNTVTELGEWAFAGTGLANVDLPDSLKTIGRCCFQGSGITELSIPASVTKLDALAKEQSDNKITKITFEGTNLSGLTADIFSNVQVYLQPDTQTPECLKKNTAYTAGETTPPRRLAVPGSEDGQVTLKDPLKVVNGNEAASQSIGVKNTGTEKLTGLAVQTATPDVCHVDRLWATSSDPNDIVYVHFYPDKGLKSGNYTADVTVTANGGLTFSFKVRFSVVATTCLSVEPAALDFGTVDKNYTQPPSKTVTVKNTGTSSVTLKAPTATNYVLGPLSRTTLAAGETATFTVQPKAGLKTGSHSEQITVKTTQDNSVSVSADFTVGKKGTTFVDVKESDWFFADVEYAYEKGLMNGVGSNRFGPNDPITREQLAAILYRYAGYKHYNVTARADLSKFRDAGSVSSYALDAISWANSQGLVNGVTSTTIQPQGSAIRAQAAAILHRFCENIAR